MKTVPLGEVAAFIRGVAYKPGDLKDPSSPGCVGVVRTKNVQRELDMRDVVFVPAELVRREEQLIREGDIVISSANSWSLVGKCCWVPRLSGTHAVGGFVTGLRASSKHLDPRYLYLWLSSPRIQVALRNTANQTTNIANLNLRRCEELPVPLPPLDEQRRIAAILDHADTICSQSASLLTHFESLRTSVLASFLSEEAGTECQLADIVDQHDRLNYGVVQPGSDFVGGVPLIRVSDLNEGRVDRSGLKLIDPAIERDYRRSRIRGTEVLVSCVGSIGVVAVAGQDDVGSNVARAVARIPISDPLLRNYVAAYLKTVQVQRYFTNELRTVSQPTLNIKQLGETLVRVPDKQRLLGIAALLTGIATQADQVRRGLGAKASLFASLQSRAFSGQL